MRLGPTLQSAKHDGPRNTVELLEEIVKTHWMVALLFAALICTAGFVSAHTRSPVTKKRKKVNEVRIGLAIAPVRLNLHDKNIHLVGLGSYIVNAHSACADCHSGPTYAVGHNPYLGQPRQFNPANYLAGGVPFGPFTSANITPDANSKPAGLTEPQFKHVRRTGQDPDGSGRLLQVIPWSMFHSMTDHDIRAIYESLRAIPSARAGGCSGPGQ
jgi:hypothetical protein